MPRSRMMLGRFVAVALGFAVASCSGDGGSGPGGSNVLLAEPFSTAAGGASILTDKWNVATSAVCSASNTDGDVLGALPQGNPTYGLVMRCTGTITSNADVSTLRTIGTYVLSAPHTFAMDARVDSVGTFGGNPQPGMAFSVNELNSGYLYAYVAVRQNVVTYYIRDQSSGVQVTRTHAVDTNFHRYEFEVGGNGNAEWRRDGALQANTSIFPMTTGNVYLELRAPPSTLSQSSKGHIDNVLITRR